MKLYIIRHAYAGENGDPQWPDDTQRPLTPEGRKHFRRMVKKLSKRGFEPKVLATSPLVRCHQTADIICERNGNESSLTVLDAMGPGVSLSDVLPWLEHHTEIEELGLVGHAPDVNRLASDLIGGGNFNFSKGAIACIEFEEAVRPGAGVLRWLAVPKIIAKR